MDRFLKFAVFFGTGVVVMLVFGRLLGDWAIIVAVGASYVAYIWYGNVKAKSETTSIGSSPVSVAPATRRQVAHSTYVDPRDGQEYRVVQLRDGKRWLAENLRFAHPGSHPASSEYTAPRPGLTYQFEDAVAACLPGWHLPTYDEWTTMLTKYGAIETNEWIGSSKLRTQSVQLLNEDGFNPIGAGRLWIRTGPASVFGKARTTPTTIKGSGGEVAEVAYFVCFTDNVYIHAESIASLYFVRCIQD